MGNQASTTSTSSDRRRTRSPETAAERAKKVIGDLNEELKKSVKTLDDDHPAAQLIDHVCGGYFDDEKYGRHSRSASFYSEDPSEDGSRTVSEDEDDRSRRSKNDKSVDTSSYMSQSDYDSDSKRRARKSNSFDTEEESKAVSDVEPATLISKPLASSFAKRCYFTKAGIGKTTQHYEGLTLTGNVVLMLAAAMKLKGCPTICDEDLRRVEQTYPNQFSRLPDELLLSSGWRRISKYCHFSNKPIPDGIPFFHSKQRLHPSGGYYFLLAAAVGMVRPLDVEPLTKDTLVLLETDYPAQCDATPSVLVRDPEQWILVNKFCFFSGGPINTEEDVYYQADFDGNPIYMLAFLSPSLTPEELYKLKNNDGEEPGLKSIAAVQEVESVYDLTERDFDDLKLYHLGPCRALPQYILQPQAWTKVLPPHFLAARQHAMMRAEEWEARHGPPPQALSPQRSMVPPDGAEDEPAVEHAVSQELANEYPPLAEAISEQLSTHEFHNEEQVPEPTNEFQRQIQEEGAFVDENAPMDEAFASRFPGGPVSPPGKKTDNAEDLPGADTPKLDPPEMDQEPPSLTIPDAVDPTAVSFQNNSPPNHFDNAEESFNNAPGHVFNNIGTVSDHSFSGEPDQHAYPDPGFQDPDPGFSDPGVMTPHSAEPSIGADGFFEDDFYEPRQQDSGFGDPYFEQQQHPPQQQQQHPHHPHPPHSSSNIESPSGEQFDQIASPVSETFQDDQFHHDQFHNEQLQNEQFHEEQLQNEQFHEEEQFRNEQFHEEEQFRDEQYQNEHFRDEEQFHNEQFHEEQFHEEQLHDEQYQDSGYQEDGYHEHGYIDHRTPQQLEFDRPQGHYAMPPPNEDDIYSGAEEKKIGSDDIVGETNGEEDFIAIKRHGYRLSDGPSPRSIDSHSMDSRSYQSSALKGAQDILRKNRRRRVEMAMKQSQSDNGSNPAAIHGGDDVSECWESGSEMSGSMVSGSSVWSEGSAGDRSSRRALILQMAKARMKTTRDSVTSPEKDKSSHARATPIKEEEVDDNNTDAENTEIDFPIELD